MRSFREEGMWTHFSSRMVHAHLQHTSAWVSCMCLIAMSCGIWFQEYFECEWSWPPCSPDMNPCHYFLWGYLKNQMYCTNPHTAHCSEDTSGNWSCCWRDYRWHATWHSRQLCGSFTLSPQGPRTHAEHVFKWRPHTQKPSMKVGFHLCIICFCTTENYKYTLHQNCCMFFWISCIRLCSTINQQNKYMYLNTQELLISPDGKYIFEIT